MKKQILNGVVWGLMFLSTMTMGYFLGVHDGKKQTINTEAEVSAIYQLLQGMSVSIRTNMNLAVKSAHYLEHSPPLAQGGFTVNECPKCLVVYNQYVQLMPEQPGYNGWYFKKFYKEPIQQRVRQGLLEEAKEKEDK
tara:strand:- start:46 stop:456 length:411 start_codon:yes stop_codon:yes gene_type:complete